MILAAFILILFAGMAKACMDEMSHHYDFADSRFYGAKGWFKYPNDFNPDHVKNPVWKLLVKTIFAPFTHFWHFCQTVCFMGIWIGLLFIAIDAWLSASANWVYYYITLFFLFRIVFEFNYTVTMKKTFSFVFLIFIFLLLNLGMVVSFNLQNWAPKVSAFKTTWFKLLGLAPGIILMAVLYIRHLIKKKKIAAK